MTETTYSLREAAEIICGGSGSAELYWLAQRLRGRAQPILEGYKAQKHWRMTEAQVAEALRRLQPSRPSVPDLPLPKSLMKRSRRRLAS